MIDGYFKDQFRSYLEEEYRKNPRMKNDVAGLAGKANPSVTTAAPSPSNAPLERLLEACDSDVCPVEGTENYTDSANPSEEETRGLVRGESTGDDSGASENGAVDGPIDKNAFLETVESGLESRKPNGTREPPAGRESINQEQGSPAGEKLEEGREELGKSGGEVSSDPMLVSTMEESSRKSGKLPKRFPPPVEPTRKPRRRRVKTLLLTEEDFASAKRDQVSDDDFWEFEEDGEREPVEGILVSQLPFKPRVEIGELERVTADEYCPLSLEEEDSCDQTYEWP